MKKGKSQKSASTDKTSNAMPMKAAKPSSGKTNTLAVAADEGKSRERMLAELNLSPVVANANTARIFGRGTFGELHLGESISVMREMVDKVKGGDLSDVEATLTAQAATLDAVFNELARRAALNMGEHLHATETYLRLAFKAQAQSRSTLETPAEVKYLKAATFVLQQNVAYQQQVNNGSPPNGNLESNTRTPAHAHGKSLNQSNELLEAYHGERLDSSTPGTAGGTYQGMATVEAINRTTD